MRTLREILQKAPVLLEIKSDSGDVQNGMLYLDQYNDIVIQHKIPLEHTGDYLIAEFVTGDGWLKIPVQSIPLAIKGAGVFSYTPKFLIYSQKESMVTRSVYDKSKIVYDNFFTQLPANNEEPRSFSISAAVQEVEYIEVNNHFLKIYTNARIHQRAFQNYKEQVQDKVIFDFQSNDGINIDTAVDLKYQIDNVLALFTKQIVNGQIKLFHSSENNDWDDCCLLEYGRIQDMHSHEFTDKTAVPYSEEAASRLIKLVRSQLRSKAYSHSLALWKQYVINSKSKVLDLEMSDLLRILENLFSYQAPTKNSKKRQKQYQTLRDKINKDEIEIDQELKEWLLSDSTEQSFVSRKKYAEMVRSLLRETDSSMSKEEEDSFVEHLNQLRNQIMHGDPPDWGILKKDDGTEIPVDITEHYRITKILTHYLLRKFIADDIANKDSHDS